MNEAEARAALRGFDGIGGVEHWIAGEAWKTARDGWTVLSTLDGWRFELRPVAGGLRVSATAPGGGAPATWVAPA